MTIFTKVARDVRDDNGRPLNFAEGCPQEVSVSKIPDDVMAAARACFDGMRWEACYWGDEEAENYAEPSEDDVLRNIALAILAERERCMGIANSLGAAAEKRLNALELTDDPVEQQNPSVLSSAQNAARLIAASIQSGERR